MKQTFHDWPLVVFTTLAILGAGLLTSPLFAARVGPSAAAPLLLPGVALLAAGLVVSLAHLGQPQRAALALARVGRSRLSNEILLAGATLAGGVLAIVFPDLSAITAFFAGAFLVALGLVYNLPGQLAWRGSLVASPLVLGAGFGALALAAKSDVSFAGAAPVIAFCLAADATLLPAAAVSRGRRRHAAAPRPLRLARSASPTCSPPACSLPASRKAPAAPSASASCSIGCPSTSRRSQHTTEAEIARSKTSSPRSTDASPTDAARLTPFPTDVVPRLTAFLD